MAATVNTATIGELLDARSIQVGVVASDKTDLLNKLVASFAGRDGVGDIQTLTDAVFEREAMLSTGVGDGIALPHAKTAAATKTLATLATTSSPIEFDSFDNQPVRLVFMLIGPPNASRDHIRILGRISRLLQSDDVRDRLVGAVTPEGIVEILAEAEHEIVVTD